MIVVVGFASLSGQSPGKVATPAIGKFSQNVNGKTTIPPMLTGSPTVPSIAPDARSATAPPVRPVVPGDFLLKTRRQTAADAGLWAKSTASTPWKVSETAILVCDMWDDIYCQMAAQRIRVMVPKMNAVLSAARSHGAMIIHCPSGTMTMYEGTPFRDRLKLAPRATPPVPIEAWCSEDSKVEPPLPIDVSKSACDDPVLGPVVRRYSRQHPGLDIAGYDGVSDSGEEIYSFCRANGIRNIAIMGVHTNMCILGRSFGIRQMTRLGMNVVLVRDLTDAMVDPREKPYVSHARGTEMIIEHIERYWCPTVLSNDFLETIPGSAGPIMPPPMLP
ncbi:isochorismatase hydrolase : Uncharacterized protein OS=Planctomyces maris DSM 8797 GN=PM8797T_14519 PE=4 SV=1: Isochorismatase [Tuwongella immobilis]|uniref:Uncharacterized protein n=2 Tax=Tuwongella immobilis TaxID=692036 RepID=A0A6C2YPL0_9BACT|nr:isochorismatase hydrolase : Uncharacterized protein OS=Planctomyces maris DSM 8797 GN=PM8797T_14519 PE=4 SV=1: Isochorismatase [Tuwongella immobilis]VTS04040.1 isochorismatase hydrolase : Uncharacterized protein OS=Planctomyces maris DSM 8797 GN=PM8797T_14519 PE=4 SV=1: Isochorismatase [Tuwongella immobilis]